MNKLTAGIIAFCFFFWLPSCQTFYQQQRAFNKNFEQGKIEEARKALEEDKKYKEGRNRLLYFMNKGVLEQMAGNFDSSNAYLEQAYYAVESFERSISRGALSLISNPTVRTYEGEDFELILIHYYKALNFLMMGDKNAALIEARRMNIRMNAIQTQYNRENRYQKDAFGHLMMGIIYDASGDNNNAFIAYRNAYDIYQSDYSELFGMSAPAQLKRDLVRTAHETGFASQRDRYMDKFGFDEIPRRSGDADLVFFWHNGLGPVKKEWSINFQIINYDDRVVFMNQSLGMNFAFDMPAKEQKEKGLHDIKIVRVAFPKYESREKFYEFARLKHGDIQRQLQPAQDIDKIAKRSLRDRMNREVGEAILRLALKQVAAHKASEQNKWLGIFASVAGAVTEKADTRHWQSLPHTIYYARMPLNEGENEVILESHPYVSTASNDRKAFTFEAEKGSHLFHFYHHLEQGKKPK